MRGSLPLFWLALAALLAIWQIGSLALGEFLLPRPLDVLAYFGEALTTGVFWQHAWASAWRVLSAMSLAWLVAFPARAHSGPCPFRGQYVVPDGLFDLSPAQNRAASPVPDLVRARGSAPRPAHCPDHGLPDPRRHWASAQGSTKNISIPSALGGRRCRCCRACSSPPPCPTP